MHKVISEVDIDIHKRKEVINIVLKKKKNGSPLGIQLVEVLISINEGSLIVTKQQMEKTWVKIGLTIFKSFFSYQLQTLQLLKNAESC